MKSICLLLFVAVVAGIASAQAGEPAEYTLHPIGQVKKSDDRTLIVLDKKYQPGLLGLDGYSHIYVFWWFDRNDTPQRRSVLQVHPMGNRDNPLTGVFATRSPVRPNLIALTLCKLLSVDGRVIEIDKTDAFDGTPVLDIKPFIPGYDTAEEATVPAWLKRARDKREKPKKAVAAADEHAGLHNVMRLSDRIFSGSQPDGEQGFQSLAEMGVKTVVNVDGARPQIELPELVATADVDSLAAAMAKIDRAFDNLKRCREAKWTTPAKHPDLVPSLRAFQLREALHVSLKELAGDYDDRLRRWLKEAEQAADGVGQAVLDGNLGRAEHHFEALAHSCKQCHAEYRN